MSDFHVDFVHILGHGVTTYSLHPGTIATDLFRGLPLWNLQWSSSLLNVILWPIVKTPQHGAQTTICCAVDEKLATHTGKYYR